MGLINLQTNLKSLKYGKDRFGGGDSGQPFIKNPIITEPGKLTHASNDFLLRGGIRAPLRAAEDVARLTKYLFNPKNPSGLLFIAKQNLLSRTAVKTEASYGASYAGGAINEGIYTPLSTLAQAGVGFAGIHLNKQGIDPTGLIPGLSINKYEDVVKKNNSILSNKIVKDFIPFNLSSFTPGLNPFAQTTSVPTIPPPKDLVLFENRLLNTWWNKQNAKNETNVILSYPGGPGSKLGIGKTRIKFADQRTGVNNSNYKKNFYYKKPREVEYKFNKIFFGDSVQFSMNNTYVKGSVSMLYAGLTGISSNELISGDSNFNFIDNPFLPSDLNVVYEPGTLNPNKNTPKSLTKNYTPETLPEDIIPYVGASSQIPLTGFEGEPKNINPDTLIKTGGILRLNIDNNVYKSGSLEENTSFKTQTVRPNRGDTPIYQTATNLGVFNNIEIEKRVNLGSPGETEGSISTILDKINGSKSYSKSGPSTIGEGGANNDFNDLVHLRIGIVDPQFPSKVEYMNFRSYIDNFSDSYNADWKSQKYMGRAEKFYKYGGFDRSISLGFTVAASSQAEMNGMYQKLNYLASSVAPKYTTAGYMAGNLVKLTVGDYIFEQYGIITGFTYDIPKESPWEINIGKGASLKDELPMIIKVTGMKFTPIHEFRPEVGIQGPNHKTRFITNEIPHNRTSRLDEVRDEREEIIAEEKKIVDDARKAAEEAAEAASLARAESNLGNPFAQNGNLSSLGGLN